VKRSIGIDISGSRISVVQLCRARGALSVERVHVRHMPSGTSSRPASAAELAAEIKTAVTGGEFDTHAPVVIAMPYGRVFFSNFRTDVTSDESVRHLLKFEVEDDFPIPFDDLVVDFCSSREVQGQDREFLVGAVSRSELHDCVKTVREAGFKCSMVSADACALHVATASDQERANDVGSVSLYADRCRTILTIGEGNRLMCVRYLNNSDSPEGFARTLKREIDLTWRALFNAAVPARTKILLSGATGIVQDLSEVLSKEMDFDIVQLAPFTRISRLSQQKDSELVVALGLALIGANKQSTALDFLAADKVKAEQTAKTKRSALVFGCLLVATGALLVAGLFVRLKALEAEHQRITQKIREVFTQTLPEEKRIVNELAQMTEKVGVLRQQWDTLAAEIHSRAPSLRILQRISERIPQGQNVSVSGISVTAESVRLSGVAPSFEAVDNVVEIVGQVPEFDSVELRNVDMDPTSNKVRFSLLIAVESR